MTLAEPQGIKPFKAEAFAKKNGSNPLIFGNDHGPSWLESSPKKINREAKNEFKQTNSITET